MATYRCPDCRTTISGLAVLAAKEYTKHQKTHVRSTAGKRLREVKGARGK
jgi:hypothetical protein